MNENDLYFLRHVAPPICLTFSILRLSTISRRRGVYMRRDKIFCPVCNRERPHTYAYKVRNEYMTRKQKFLKFITMGNYKANMYTFCWKCEVCGNRVIRDH